LLLVIFNIAYNHISISPCDQISGKSFIILTIFLSNYYAVMIFIIIATVILIINASLFC
jgi:hypothetical protein